MKVYPSEATPPKNWATFKKEPLPFLLRWSLKLFFGSIFLLCVLAALIMIGISLFELTTVLFYEWTH